MSSLDEFCCICVKKCSNLENLNDADGENVKYHYKLSTCVPELKWLDDYNICTNCVERLNSAYDFIQDCIKSEELRKQQIKRLDDEKLTCFLKDSYISENIFICNMCKKEFKLKRSLKLHITRIHNRKEPKLEIIKESKVKPETDDYIGKDKVISNINEVKDETEHLDSNETNDNYDENYSSDDDVKPNATLGRGTINGKHP
ncbi:hypothetical protein NQ318_021572 [Aromia moschata]|uniref:C2H2-type domain-containing protein n=1 Tax=Aromia moschata TaxID=1265417 RepID=A0AAV8YIK5_9CUCU|nr:hypothetical protein NQ318_021572 [Aromia moschata]